MASVNPHTRELVFKLVFYGPGLGGKTTTLQYIYAATKSEYRGKMVSLATPTDRTLYFDFLPIRVPRVRGMAVRLQLFTVPGQVYYAATRKLVLSGADGVVFVADSQRGREEVNQEALDDLHANLAEHNRKLDEVPHTFHWNKRDLAEVLPTEELDRRFNKLEAPSLGTVATKGEGVFEGLERITRLVLKSYEQNPQVKIEASSGGKFPEEGIAQALRDLETQSFDSPTKLSHSLQSPIPPAVETAPSMPVPSPRAPEVKEKPSSSPTGSRSGQWQKVVLPDGTTAEERVLSFAELWPDQDRESVRQAESMLAARDAVNAILACDVLVTRVLASAAGLVGTLDAPRDPAVVALLLGLDGARYMIFRSLVRAARHRETVSMREALECFAFALEARRSRARLAPK